jgi:hypothetical protein
MNQQQTTTNTNTKKKIYSNNNHMQISFLVLGGTFAGQLCYATEVRYVLNVNAVNTAIITSDLQ